MPNVASCIMWVFPHGAISQYHPYGFPHSQLGEYKRQSSIKYQNGNYTSLMGKLEMAGGSITRYNLSHYG